MLNKAVLVNIVIALKKIKIAASLVVVNNVIIKNKMEKAVKSKKLKFK